MKNIIIWNNATLNGLVKALDLCARKYAGFHHMNATVSAPIMTAKTNNGAAYSVRVFKSYGTAAAIDAENVITGSHVVFIPDAYKKAAQEQGATGAASGKQINRFVNETELGIVVRTGYKPGLTLVNGFRGTEYKPHVSEIYVKPDKAARMLLDSDGGAEMCEAFRDILDAVWETLPDSIPGGDTSLTEWAKSEVTSRNPKTGSDT